MQGERMLSVRETAEVAGICLDTVRSHLNSGKLPGVRVGRSWRIPESQLVILLRSGDYTRSDASKNVPAESTAEKATGELEVVDILLRENSVKSTVMELVTQALENAEVRLGPSRRILKELEHLLDDI
ncbi:DNA-binding protein [bacterium]|nr:MAG: DNA-binding protein [bacterium]